MTTNASGGELDPFDLSVLKGSRTLAIIGGIVFLAIGITLLVWPKETFKALAVIIGIGLVIGGIGWSLDALMTHRAGSYWGLLLVRGVLDVLVGLFAIFYPDITVALVAIFVGADLIVGGVIQIVVSRRASTEVELRSRFLWRGIFWIVGGLVIIVLPGASVTLFAWIIGFFFVLSGLVMLLVGFQLGKAERQLVL
jgi:uncharacterized membrane protein HdeD (DUF308 family)